MAVTIMQGDSYPVFINLTQDFKTLVPEMVDDLEICVGTDLRYYWADKSVLFDTASKRWYIWPTQEETFSLDPGTHKVEIRVKYHNQNNANVKGFTITERIKVTEATSREVL